MQAAKALDQQARADEQYERQSNFGGDERASQSMTPRAAANVLASFFERIVQIDSRCFKRRQQPKNNSGKQRDAEREEEHGRVHSYTRWSEQFRGTDGHQQVGSLPRQHQTQRATSSRQDQTLSQQLSDDPRASRAQRDSDSDLFLPRHTASQKQVRHVRTGNEQHKSDGAEQDEQGLANLTAELGPQRNEQDSPVGIEVRIRL